MVYQKRQFSYTKCTSLQLVYNWFTIGLQYCYLDFQPVYNWFTIGLQLVYNWFTITCVVYNWFTIGLQMVYNLSTNGVTFVWCVVVCGGVWWCAVVCGGVSTPSPSIPSHPHRYSTQSIPPPPLFHPVHPFHRYSTHSIPPPPASPHRRSPSHHRYSIHSIHSTITVGGDRGWVG